jgi:hypothetical protein
VVEDGLRFDVHQAVKASGGTGRLRAWHWSYDGQTISSSIGYRVTLGDEGSGLLVLDYKAGEQPYRLTFHLMAWPCRFGGRRWFAVCPETGAPVAKLYKTGGPLFRSRKAIGAAYRCQGETPPFRILRRRDKLLDRLKTDDPDWQPRPKGMRRRTYARLKARLRTTQHEMLCAARARWGISSL